MNQTCELVLADPGKQHTPAISALHAELFRPGWSPDNILQILENPASTSLVACAAGSAEVVGFILGQRAADEAEILTIGVAAGWQRRGVGRRLLSEWMGRVESAGACRLFLEVAADNTPALFLYERQGFREVGRRNGYYTRPRAPPCDALVLGKQVSTHPLGGRPRDASL
jgi:ribosomal-protein-alanine N-acetyltransferase